MRMSTLFGALSIATGVAGTSAMSTPRDPANYLMTMEIFDGDRLVGTPKITVAADKPAEIEISDAPGNRYAMTVTASPQSATTVAIKSKIDFASAGSRQTASPSLLVAFDTSSTIQFGIDDAKSKPFRVTFSISKVS